MDAQNQPEQNENAPVYKKLRVFNIVMSFFHLTQAAAMLWVSNSFSLPITTSYLKFDPILKSLTSNPQELIRVQIGPVVALFLLLSAIAHALLASPSIYEWYVKNLKRKTNYARWWEYAFSSSLMIVVIALLCGFYDLGGLILLFTLNATMNFWGLMMEHHNQLTQKTDWTAFLFGCLAGIVPWIVLALYFYGAVGDYADSIPSFVYWILGSLFFFFNCFAINMFLQYKKIGPWRDYLFGEKAYIVLSLVAKSLLAWQVFSGTLRPE